MDLDEAERAALEGGSKASGEADGVAHVRQPRDPVEAWEFRVAAQFENLRAWADEQGRLLKPNDLPKHRLGAPGQEHEVFHDRRTDRLWKVTFPGQAGCGPRGFFTPFGYLRRLRLSNLIFGDDVEFEGLLARRGGPSLVTSQFYVMPHPDRAVPTEAEIRAFLMRLGFRISGDWERSDGVVLHDTHDRNFIRAATGEILAIDVQPELKSGFDWDAVIPFTQAH